jgi:hypothetical protein
VSSSQLDPVASFPAASCIIDAAKRQAMAGRSANFHLILFLFSSALMMHGVPWDGIKMAFFIILFFLIDFGVF